MSEEEKLPQSQQERHGSRLLNTRCTLNEMLGGRTADPGAWHMSPRTLQCAMPCPANDCELLHRHSYSKCPYTK